MSVTSRPTMAQRMHADAVVAALKARTPLTKGQLLMLIMDVRHPDLTTADRWVLAALLWFQGNNENAYPLMPTIAAQAGVDPRSCRRSLAKLDNLGLLSVAIQHRGRRPTVDPESVFDQDGEPTGMRELAPRLYSLDLTKLADLFVAGRQQQRRHVRAYWDSKKKGGQDVPLKEDRMSPLRAKKGGQNVPQNLPSLESEPSSRTYHVREPGRAPHQPPTDSAFSLEGNQPTNQQPTNGLANTRAKSEEPQPRSRKRTKQEEDAARERALAEVEKIRAAGTLPPVPGRPASDPNHTIAPPAANSNGEAKHNGSGWFGARMLRDDSHWPGPERVRLGMTQAQLAELSGVPREYIAVIERGARNPGPGIVAKLEDALRRSVN